MKTPLPVPLANYQPYRVISGGELYTFAGQGCRDPLTNACVGLTRDHSGAITSYDIREQCRGVFANIDRLLAATKLTKTHIVDISVFLKNIDDIADFNQIWNQYFDQVSPVPTRTTVAVSGLPGDNFVEMKVIAFRPTLTKE